VGAEGQQCNQALEQSDGSVGKQHLSGQLLGLTQRWRHGIPTDSRCPQLPLRPACVCTCICTM
jgi:hypothetical protein